MSRSVLMHGICTNHLSGKPAGHRNMPSFTKPEALSHGHPWQSISLNHRRCQRAKRLAHLCRPRSLSDHQSPQVIQQREIRNRTGTNSLRPRCNNDRSLPVHVSMGKFPENQRRNQATYSSGSQKQHPDVYTHLRWQASRSQHPRFHPFGARRFLRDGSRLSGFRQIIQPFPDVSLFPDPRQIQSEVPQSLLTPGRSINWPDLRSVGNAHRLLSGQGLSGKASSCKILRCRNQPGVCVSDQQFYTATTDHCSTVSMSLASGTVLQMDQAEPAHQKLLWNIGECREDTNLDRHLRLCPCCHLEKTTSSAGQSLHNFTGVECDGIRKNVTYSATYKLHLQTRKYYIP